MFTSTGRYKSKPTLFADLFTRCKKIAILISLWQPYDELTTGLQELAISIYFCHLIGWRNYLICIFGTMLARGKLATSSRRARGKLAMSLRRARGELATSSRQAYSELATSSRQACGELATSSWWACDELTVSSRRACGEPWLAEINYLICIFGTGKFATSLSQACRKLELQACRKLEYFSVRGRAISDWHKQTSLSAPMQRQAENNNPESRLKSTVIRCHCHVSWILFFSRLGIPRPLTHIP